MEWYRKISRTYDDFSDVPDAITYFEDEYEKARIFLNVQRKKVEDIACQIPAIMEYRYGQLQELETILEYLNRCANKRLIECKRHYLEHYVRDLSDKTANQYAEIDQKVEDVRLLIDEVALVRNKFLSLTKGLEMLHYQISNIIKMRCAGIDDAII